jgi:NAD(P)-dependent dehydrogenase (short-subunit alcohol dehydrogenase family)
LREISFLAKTPRTQRIKPKMVAKNPPKLILLTGVTRGLGRAMTEKFIALGHTVLGCGRSRDAIDELRRSFPKPHDFEVVDISRDHEVQSWAKRLLLNHGPPELLVNNAALINANAPLWKVPREEFDQVIDVNINGVTNVIRHFLPAMIERRSGVIVNFSSYWGRSTAPDVAPYCATKWAIEGLTRALAQELPKGLAALPLNPGIIDTDMLRSCFGADAGRYPSAKEWSEQAVPFLLKLGPKDNGKPVTVPSY